MVKCRRRDNLRTRIVPSVPHHDTFVVVVVGTSLDLQQDWTWKGRQISQKGRRQEVPQDVSIVARKGA